MSCFVPFYVDANVWEKLPAIVFEVNALKTETKYFFGTLAGLLTIRLPGITSHTTVLLIPSSDKVLNRVQRRKEKRYRVGKGNGGSKILGKNKEKAKLE